MAARVELVPVEAQREVWLCSGVARLGSAGFNGHVGLDAPLDGRRDSCHCATCWRQRRLHLADLWKFSHH